MTRKNSRGKERAFALESECNLLLDGALGNEGKGVAHRQQTQPGKHARADVGIPLGQPSQVSLLIRQRTSAGKRGLGRVEIPLYYSSQPRHLCGAEKRIALPFVEVAHAAHVGSESFRPPSLQHRKAYCLTLASRPHALSLVIDRKQNCRNSGPHPTWLRPLVCSDVAWPCSWMRSMSGAGPVTKPICGWLAAAGKEQRKNWAQEKGSGWDGKMNRAEKFSRRQSGTRRPEERIFDSESKRSTRPSVSMLARLRSAMS